MLRKIILYRMWEEITTRRKIIKFVEYVTKFICLKTTLTHENCMHDKVKKQISSMEHLLYFVTEYFVFPYAIQKYKDSNL
jgi:hypothetical protein